LDLKKTIILIISYLIFREEYMVEAMEIVEMYCDLVLARFGLVTQMKELDEGLSEAISTLIWVAPRMHTDVQVIFRKC
jgi:vacuolar protein sorting-associated protein IST1